MKKLAFLIISWLLFALLFACGNNAETSTNTEEKAVKNEIIKLDSLSNELDRSSDQIDDASKNLDDALKELDL